jgi:3-ketosteroid 9alpha-monooxygenase subunit A
MTHTFPRGWFVLSLSDALAPGAVQAVRYFGRDLVLFRFDGGAACVADAHCPRCGAHFGFGGRIEGEALRCARRGHDALLRAWTVREQDGMVFVWHDPDGGAPEYDLPPIAEHGAPDWTRWNHARLRVRTHPREIVENVADVAHFAVVHRFHIDEFANDLVGHTARQTTRGHGEIDWGDGIRPVTSTATYHGPAYQITYLSGHFDVVLINAHTPCDADSLDLFFAVSVRVIGTANRTEPIAQGYADAIRQGFFEDISIWEHKRFRDRPILCDGDGPIMALRRWYAQFYEPRAARA